MTLLVHNNLLMPYHACNYFCMDQSLNITSFLQICDHIVLWFFSQCGRIWDLLFILCICCWDHTNYIANEWFTLRGVTTSHLKWSCKVESYYLIDTQVPLLNMFSKTFILWKNTIFGWMQVKITHFLCHNDEFC